MGSYAECWVGNLLITSTKNSVDPAIMQFFRPADRIVRSSTASDLPRRIADGWRRDGTKWKIRLTSSIT